MTSPNPSDYENALWNKTFYSSPAVLTQSSSSNHINNFRKSVNIPSSASTRSVNNAISGNSDPKAAPFSSTTHNITSLMKVSPSMKALESALNCDIPAPQRAEIINEEDDEDVDGSATSFPGNSPLNEDSEKENNSHHPPLSFQHPASRASAFSVQTFHTAKSADNVGLVMDNSPSSFATLEGADIAMDATPKAPKTPDSYPESYAEPLSESFHPSADEVVSTSQASNHLSHDHIPKQSARPLDTPQFSNPKYMATSISYPVLPSKENDPPSPPSKDSRPRPYIRPSDEEIDEDKPETPVKDGTTTKSKPPITMKPVRSMLDNAFVPTTKDSPRTGDSISVNSLRNKSSAFATPRSEAKSDRSTRKTNSDFKSNLSSTMMYEKTPVQESPTVSNPSEKTNSKRFSFKGLFKIKTKHSPSKLKDIDEFPNKPSVPTKISSKSQSTPNFRSSGQEKTRIGDWQKETKRNLFNKKKSESNVSTLNNPSHIREESSKDVDSNEKPITSNDSHSTNTTKQHKEPLDSQLTFSKDINGPDEQATSTDASKRILATPTSNIRNSTIREVDDSDYSPNLTNQSSASMDDVRSVDTPALDGFIVESENEAGKDDQLNTFLSKPNYLGITMDPRTCVQFGSPFAVEFSSEKFTTSPPMGHEGFKPPLSPSCSVNSRVVIEQLAGETLFPKSLNAFEVESIVSLERSRSMRSIKSNNKRSSFLNYDGSDENIILGKDINSVPQNSMKRSVSILKNSPSTQSLKAEPYPSIDTAMNEHSPSIQEYRIEQTETYSPDFHENFGDFIEFSDFVDIDNLDFTTSPLPEPYHEVSPAPSISVPVEQNDVTTDEDPDVTPSKVEIENEIEAYSPSSIFEQSNFEDNPEKLSTSKTQTHEIINVPSDSSSESEVRRDEEETRKQELKKMAPNTSPLDQTYKFAIEETRAREEMGSSQRPISMSFKGFNGSSFKYNQMEPVQSIESEDSSYDQKLTVGQGFGSSDDESEVESEVDEDISISYTNETAQQRYQNDIDIIKGYKNPKVSNSVERRQQHMKHVLDLQPPSGSRPFHHDRIPSISDQSTTSSPKSLTSFISRIRKSPMGSPKMQFHRPSVKFSSRIILYDTYHHDEYDRHPEIATCNQLTPLLAQQIKEELNELKANMDVHEDSICYTQFF